MAVAHSRHRRQWEWQEAVAVTSVILWGTTTGTSYACEWRVAWKASSWGLYSERDPMAASTRVPAFTVISTVLAAGRAQDDSCLA